jgi:hypothetical protein
MSSSDKSAMADDRCEMEDIECRRKLRSDRQRREMEAITKTWRVKFFGQENYALAERAWAAGFFDGEGHASARVSGGQFHCSIDQVDVINLERFRAVVGVGRITEVKRTRNGQVKRLHQWSVTNQRDLEAVVKEIGIFLTPAKSIQLARAQSVPLRTALEHDRPLGRRTFVAEIDKPSH